MITCHDATTSNTDSTGTLYKPGIQGTNIICILNTQQRSHSRDNLWSADMFKMYRVLDKDSTNFCTACQLGKESLCVPVALVVTPCANENYNSCVVDNVIIAQQRLSSCLL